MYFSKSKILVKVCFIFYVMLEIFLDVILFFNFRIIEIKVFFIIVVVRLINDFFRGRLIIVKGLLDRLIFFFLFG